MTDLTMLDTFEGHEPGLILEIYWSKDGMLKKYLYNGMEEWLNIGENTHIKRREKLDVHFPLLFFTAIEAKKCGYIIPYNYKYEILSYNGLTCDPEDLIHVKSLLFEEVIGYHRNEDFSNVRNARNYGLFRKSTTRITDIIESVSSFKSNFISHYDIKNGGHFHDHRFNFICRTIS
jgi:hypothetical protein